MSSFRILVVVIGIIHIGRFSTVMAFPEFYSSDPVMDARLNHLFTLHSRATLSDDSLRDEGGLVPAQGTVALWRDWEIDMLFWHDFGPTNYPLDNRPGMYSTLLTTIPVDRFGYYFTAHDGLAGGMLDSGALFSMGWPFPDYKQSLEMSVGYQWNGNDQEGWEIEGASSHSVSEGYWQIESANVSQCRLTSPTCEVHWFFAPFVEVGIIYDAIDTTIPENERAFKISWTTKDDPAFTEEKSVSSKDFPVRPLVNPVPGQVYRVFLPMYLHPKWKDHIITQVRLEPIETPQSGKSRFRLNFFCLNFDTRHVINNPINLRAYYRKFFWDGDKEFLKQHLPTMRRLMEFMLTHMKGRELHLLDQSWFVMHNGIGWDDVGKGHPGQGIGSNYFDIVCMGPRDIQSCVQFYKALQAMTEIEAYIEQHPDLDSPKPSVDGPDGITRIQYQETADSLQQLIEPVRLSIHREFWNQETKRYAGWRNSRGELKDYGYTHFNWEALEAGIPDPATAQTILDWLNGTRIVDGDDAKGYEDIYHWRFASRMSTKKNNFDYPWVWTGWVVPFGDQVQDGGAVLFTTFYDIRGRLRYGDVEGAWKVWKGMLEHHADVMSAGGKGPDFYRLYYAENPSRGKLQGGGTPGGLGLDREFVESLLTPCAWPLGWLGIESPQPGVLVIAPSLPVELTKMGIRNLVYRGNKLSIEVTKDTIEISGTIKKEDDSTLELHFRGNYPPDAVIKRNGFESKGEMVRGNQEVVLRVPIQTGIYQIQGE